MEKTSEMSNVKLVDSPKGHTGEGFFATSLDQLLDLPEQIQFGLFRLLPLAAV